MLRVPASNLTPGSILLDARSSRYVARVHRMAVGSSFVLFDPVGKVEADAELLEIAKDGVRCRVGPVRPAAVRAVRAITLLQGLPKGEKMDAIVRDATELGATSLVVAGTARSIVRLDERAAAARQARWERIAVEAARQSGRGDAPAIIGPLSWNAAVSGCAATHEVRLCLWEQATDPVGPMLLAAGATNSMVIAVGPEGGLEKEEVDAARESGFAVASLGAFVLRTETVAAAVLGAALVLGSIGEKGC